MSISLWLDLQSTLAMLILSQLEMSFFLMHIVAMGCIKLSFVFFYRRLFVTGKPRSRFGIISLGMLVVLVLWTVAFIILFFANCGSHLEERFASPATINKYCPSGAVSNEGLAIADFVTDIMVYSLPIPIVSGHWLTFETLTDECTRSLGYTCPQIASSQCWLSLELVHCKSRSRPLLRWILTCKRAIVTSLVRLVLFVNFVASEYPGTSLEELSLCQPVATGKKKDPTADEECKSFTTLTRTQNAYLPSAGYPRDILVYVRRWDCIGILLSSKASHL